MENEIDNISSQLSMMMEIEKPTTTLLPIPLIHHIFDTYIGRGYKLMIHKEGSSDEDRSKILSIELIMISRMEEYFKDVLLSDKFKYRLCNAAAKKGYLNCLQWAVENGCPWNRDGCLRMARGNGSVLNWIKSTPAL